MANFDDFEYDDSEDIEEEENYNDDLDDDSVSIEEEGFMKGYNEDDVYCAYCNALIEKEDSICKRIDGELEYFCSEECLSEFEKEQEF